jgi:hypothetical protein
MFYNSANTLKYKLLPEKIVQRQDIYPGMINARVLVH